MTTLTDLSTGAPSVVSARDGVVAVRSPVFFDELDALGVLHNARYAVHVERALSAFYASHGGRWRPGDEADPDQFIVVRAFDITFDAPVRSVGDLTIELWVDKLGRTSCTYGFRVCNADATVTHARGSRTIVKVDPDTLRPARWSDAAVARHRPLLRSQEHDA
ncbi:MAG TPA: hotdog domain-containing protein [Egibacteraceae bacterium]